MTTIPDSMDLSWDLLFKIATRLNNMSGGGGGGSGTVTSVGLALPNIFSVSGSPVTTSGTLSATLASQAAKLFFASPNGSSGTPSFRAIVPSDLGTGTADATTFLRGDGTWQINAGGTVTSVALTAPAEITVAGSPVTSSGTLALTWASAAQNSVFAGPSASAGTPAFRTLVAGDIPNLDAAKITTGIIAAARLGTGATSDTVLHGDGTFGPVLLNTQSSGTLNVNRGGTSFASYVKGQLLVASGASTMVQLTVGSDGQVLTADSAQTSGIKWATPTTGTVTSVNLTQPAAGITVSGGPVTTSGSITLALADDLAALEALSSTGYAKRTGTSTWTVGTAISLTADVSGVLPVANGGTSQSSFTKGDILAAAGSTTLNKLAVGSDGQILTADAASTNGIKWAAASGGISGLTAGRVTLSTGATTIGDDAALLFSSASSVGTLTLGNAANGILKGGAKLIFQTTSNGDIELTPNGTGKTNVTAGILVLPSGSQVMPSLQPGGNTNFGIYLSGEPSIVITAGGGNTLTVANGNIRCAADLRANSDVGNDLGVSGTRWKDCYVRSYIHSLNTITTTTTLDNTYYAVLCNSSSAFTVNLPAAASNTGRVYYIKNINTGTVTVDGNASETIDGATTYALSTQYQAIMIVSNGTNWFII